MPEFWYLKYSYKNGPESQVIMYETKPGLLPLPAVGMDAGKISKIPAHHAIEYIQGNLLRDTGIASHAVHQARKSSAGAQQAKANLRIWRFPQCIQKVPGLNGPFKNMLMDKTVAANGGPEQLKAAGDLGGTIGMAESAIGKLIVPTATIWYF